MSWTKGQIVAEAFAELALAGYEFDTTPEEQLTAVRRLDALIATWEARGLKMGYNFSASYDDADPNAESGLADSDIEAAYLNLAIRMAATIGKQLSPDTRKAARDALDAIRTRAAQPIQQQMPNRMPKGAGNRGWRWTNYYPIPDTGPVQVDESGMSTGG